MECIVLDECEIIYVMASATEVITTRDVLFCFYA